MSHAGREATDGAVRHGMRVGTENERARKRIAAFRKDDVANSFAGMEFRDALLAYPLASLLLRYRVLRSNRRIVMIEDDDDFFRIRYLLATHVAEQVGGAGRAAII